MSERPAGCLSSTDMLSMLRLVVEQLDGFEAPVREDVKSVVARLETLASERACPTCGSTYFNFEEQSA